MQFFAVFGAITMSFRERSAPCALHFAALSNGCSAASNGGSTPRSKFKGRAGRGGALVPSPWVPGPLLRSASLRIRRPGRRRGSPLPPLSLPRSVLEAR